VFFCTLKGPETDISVLMESEGVMAFCELGWFFFS